jgi:hypothetical protein
MSEDLNMSCKSGPACVYESDTSAERVDETPKYRQEDWYGQAQWQFGYERGWDKGYEAGWDKAMEKREWVSLTFREYMEAIKGKEDIEYCWHALEAKLKEKNT